MKRTSVWLIFVILLLGMAFAGTTWAEEIIFEKIHDGPTSEKLMQKGENQADYTVSRGTDVLLIGKKSDSTLFDNNNVATIEYGDKFPAGEWAWKSTKPADFTGKITVSVKQLSAEEQRKYVLGTNEYIVRTDDPIYSIAFDDNYYLQVDKKDIARLENYFMPISVREMKAYYLGYTDKPDATLKGGNGAMLYLNGDGNPVSLEYSETGYTLIQGMDYEISEIAFSTVNYVNMASVTATYSIKGIGNYTGHIQVQERFDIIGDMVTPKSGARFSKAYDTTRSIINVTGDMFNGVDSTWVGVGELPRADVGTYQDVVVKLYPANEPDSPKAIYASINYEVTKASFTLTTTKPYLFDKNAVYEFAYGRKQPDDDKFTWELLDENGNVIPTSEGKYLVSCPDVTIKGYQDFDLMNNDWQNCEIHFDKPYRIRVVDYAIVEMNTVRIPKGMKVYIPYDEYSYEEELAEYKYTSSNNKVVVVENNYIRGAAKGKACISIKPLNGAGETKKVDVYVLEIGLSIPQSIREIRSEAFDGAGLQCVVIPETTETLRSGCFADCASLASVVVYSTDCFIEPDAFENVSEDCTMICYAGSTAHDYAIRNRMPFVFIGT